MSVCSVISMTNTEKKHTNRLSFVLSVFSSPSFSFGFLNLLLLLIFIDFLSALFVIQFPCSGQRTVFSWIKNCEMVGMWIVLDY